MAGSPNRLVIVVSGVGSREEDWAPLLDRLKAEPELTDYRTAQEDAPYRCKWVFWSLRSHWSWFRFDRRSRRSASDLARELCIDIEYETRAQAYPEGVLILAHSAGGVLARRPFLDAAQSSGPERYTWHGTVRRIVLLAALNRGFDLRRHRRLAAAWTLLTWLGLGRSPFAAELLRGSAFITNLRLEWLSFFRRGEDVPEVVQVRGDQDPVVAEEDSADIRMLPQARLDTVPGADHSGLYRVDDSPNGQRRYAILREAVLGPVPRTPLPVDPQYGTATALVFVLHGIRTNNYDWPEDLKQEIAKLDPAIGVILPTYGYFSALGFALSHRRKGHLAWFLDEYTDLVARCWHLDPLQDFHFAGHSNGTYILGECLKQYRALKFNRVFLAGSVLPRDYDWRLYQAAGQIQRVRSDRSNQDVPVALLCSALRGLRMRDLGTGGFDGFDRGTDEFAYHDGGHGRPLEPDTLPFIAEYLVTGTVTPPAGGPDPAVLRQCRPTTFLRWLSRFVPWGLYLAPLTVLLALCWWFGWLAGWWLGAASVVVMILWLIALLETY